MLLIGRLGGYTYGKDGDDHGKQIEEAVHCLGKNADAPGYGGDYDLDHHQPEYHGQGKLSGTTFGRKHGLSTALSFYCRQPLNKPSPFTLLPDYQQ